MTNADIGITVDLDTKDLKRGVDEAKHSLGGLADFTKGALTAGFAVGVAGIAALGAGLGLSVKAAMEAQQAEAQLDAVLKSTGEASQKRMAEYVAAQNKIVTVNVLSKKEQEKLTKENQKATEAYNKLGDKLKTAAAKLFDMENRMKSSKAPTASATLALERQRQTVADLEAEIAKGVPTLGEFATKSMTLAESLGLTPPVAQMTKEELLKLASSLQSVTTSGDEAILSAESMILTFTGIGKEIFPEVTETVLDMAYAMNSGATPSAEQLKQQAIQLGKALNDPKKGLSALTRVGVTFTDAQKTMIEKMVDAGDTMGAQKIILAELATEFGGSARAAATTFGGKMEQITNIIGDLQEIIGMALIPILTTAAEKLKEFLTDERVQNIVKQIGNLFAALTSGEDDLNAYWEIFDSIFGKDAADLLIDLVKKGQTFAAGVKEFLGDAAKEFEKFWKDIQPHLRNVENWLKKDGVDALQTFYQKAREFDSVSEEFQALLKEMGKTFAAISSDMESDAEVTFPSLAEIISGAMTEIKTDTLEKMNFLRDTFKTINFAIAGDWRQVFQFQLPQLLGDAFVLMLNSVGMNGEQMRQLFEAKLSEMVDAVFNLKGSLSDAFIYVFQDLPGQFNTAGQAMIQGLIDGLWAMAGNVNSALWAIIQQAINNALNLFGGGNQSFTGMNFGGARPMLPVGNTANFGGVTINFNGENAPRTAAEAQHSAGLFLDALRAKGYVV